MKETSRYFALLVSLRLYAVLCRLFLRLVSNTIAAEPLAILTPKHHLRLGL